MNATKLFRVISPNRNLFQRFLIDFGIHPTNARYINNAKQLAGLNFGTEIIVINSNSDIVDEFDLVCRARQYKRIYVRYED